MMKPFRRCTPVALIALVAARLVAPADASAQAVPNFFERVTRIVYDYDADGTTDATDVITYGG
jgi:hypothetical protein